MVQTTKELCVMDNHSSPVDSNPDFLLWSIDRNAAKKTILRDTIPAITRPKPKSSSAKSGYNELVKADVTCRVWGTEEMFS